MLSILKKLTTNIISHLTSFGQNSKIPKTREATTPSIREVGQMPKGKKKSARGQPATDSLKCPYCLSLDFIHRGFRQKKHEQVQLYFCKTCNKTFTAQISKGKHYPLAAVLDALSAYYLGYSLDKTCQLINMRHQLNIKPSSLSNWLTEYSQYCPFARMRSYALKKYQAGEMVISAALAHQQFFRYRFHQAKCQLIIKDDFRHRNFGPLQEFLEMVPAECPHQYFSKGRRASEVPMTFSKRQMIVRAKKNYANKLCQFVLQSVKERKKRHDALQRFMLCNDSVSVATEVPVYLTKDDLEHMQTQLGFKMYPKPVSADVSRSSDKNPNTKSRVTVAEVAKLGMGKMSKDRRNTGTGTLTLPRLITGHIDILQIRNGQIHILDYKPKAEKTRPIEQLTLYALALSRLTGLRMFDFKCAWFDERDYFEFYPLHVVYKRKKGRRRRKINTKEGVYKLNLDKNKIISLRPVIKQFKKHVLH